MPFTALIPKRAETPEHAHAALTKAKVMRNGGLMRNFIHMLMAFIIAVTCWPTDSFGQNAMWRQQQMMQQQRMQQDQMRRQQQMQRQQREAQRRQQAVQRRQMEEQRRRQQAAMQQRQRQMQVRKQQMQVQRQKMAEQRRIQQRKRQQDMQRKQAQRQQVAQKQAQQTARLARDKAVRLQRDRRLQELKKRTRLQQQNQQRQKAAQQTNTIALLSRTTNRASAIGSPKFTQRRQQAAQRFAKLRASRPATKANGTRVTANKPAIVANKQFQRQKLQEFRERKKPIAVAGGASGGGKPPYLRRAANDNKLGIVNKYTKARLWTKTSNRSAAKNAFEHYKKHRSDFPDLKNSVQYAKTTRNFLQKPPPGTLTKIRKNGDVVRYNPKTNTFGIMDKNGSPRTMFKPKPHVHGYKTNMEYFNAQ